METKANYVLIGACTLVAIVLMLGFFVWLAKFQVDRQYAYYDIYFDSVSGLNRAAEVRFSGLTVGQVQSTRTRDRRHGPGACPSGGRGRNADPGRGDGPAPVPGRDRRILRLDHPRPGRRAADAEDRQRIPVIPGERSVVQSLTEDAPDLLRESIQLVREFQNIVGTENQAKVTGILGNIEAASGKLEQALADFTSISKTVSDATGQISLFTDKLDPIAASVGSVLGEAEKTLGAMTGAFNQAGTTLATADGALKTVDGAAQGVSGLIDNQAADALTELKGTITDLRTTVEAIGTEANAVLAAYGDTAGLVNARLTELETTIADLDVAIAGTTTTMVSVDTAATSVTTLVEGEGAALVSDARTTLASLDRSIAALEQAATQDLPAMITDVRGALANVNRTIDQVAGDVTTFTGDLAPLIGKAGTTLDTASRTFRDASLALDRLQPAIAAAEQTMASAQGTFASAERIINEDVGPATADVRQSAERLNAAVEQVAADLPAITAELKATLARATATVASIDTVVQQSARPIGDFTAQGLPQFVRFTKEARELIQRLDRIAGQLERDPARFFLGAQAPDLRR